VRRRKASCERILPRACLAAKRLRRNNHFSRQSIPAYTPLRTQKFLLLFFPVFAWGSMK
jgi:hypothetical protein